MSTTTTITNNNVGIFHRRELKSPAISFSSLEGRKIFAESLKSGFLDSYFPLAEQFTTQGDKAFCGIGSLTMALNAILIDPKRAWQGSVWRWFDESMLDCCEPLDIVRLNGITLPKLACLAKCNGAGVELNLASSITVEDFRKDIMNVTSSSSETSTVVMIVSYSRPILNQTGGGHFSPVGGYNQEKDLVLIMDVARFKYPPHWVPLRTLFESMKTIGFFFLFILFIYYIL
jgi:glutathione gamma-glutamylcysteinyltransferase